MLFLYELVHLWLAELKGLLTWPNGFPAGLLGFLDIYPFLLSLMWSFFALKSLFRESRINVKNYPLPSYSVLIPFYRELGDALRSAHSLRHISPAPEEILLIDDGSPTRSVIPSDQLPPRTRILRLERNQGKAAALNSALSHVQSEVIVCLDADTTAISRDWSSMLIKFKESGMGGVTGKIWPKHANTLVQSFQSLDYLAVICLIKAAESQWHNLTTVSGAWVAFRRQAILSCGGWNERSSAEDIDLSWRMQAKGWQLDYDAQWVASVEMAPTWRSVWKQRQRWSSGLGRALRDHFRSAFTYRATHTPVAFLNIFTNSWIVLFVLAGIWRIANLVQAHLQDLPMDPYLPGGNTMGYWTTCLGIFLLQLSIAIAIDRGAWSRYPRMAMLAPFYPLYFWLILFPAFLVGFPKGILRRDKGKWARTVRLGEVQGKG